MYYEQVFPRNLDKYYRCGDGTWLQINDEKSRSPIRKKDAAIERKINHTLWKDNALRITYNNGIDIHVPVKYQQEDKKIENISNQASSTLKTEEQVLSEELLANDSLGGFGRMMVVSSLKSMYLQLICAPISLFL